MEVSFGFHRILQYLINIDLENERFSASSTCGEHKEDEASEESREVLCLPASDATNRLSADEKTKTRTGWNLSLCAFPYVQLL